MQALERLPRKRRPRRRALKERQENLVQPAAEIAPAHESKAQLSDADVDSVLVPTLSLLSLSRESSIGPPQPVSQASAEEMPGDAELAGIEQCLTVTRLATRETEPPLPGDRSHSLHVELLGGDEDLPLFALHAEPAKHTAMPLPTHLFSRALSGLLPGEAAPPPERSTQLEAAPSWSPTEAGAEPVPEGQSPSALSDGDLLLAGEQALATDAGGSERADADEAVPAPVVAPLCPQPIAVFGGPNTLQTRLAQLEHEIVALNMVQQQLRLISGSDFVPVLPHCPVIQRLLLKTGLFPMTLVSAAARFQEMLEMVPSLQAHVQETGFWQFCSVACATPEGRLHVVGYAPGPFTLAHASPRLRAAFTACVFHEANRQESGPGYAVHVITPEAILPVPKVPAYTLGDLQEWLGIVLEHSVCPQTVQEIALLAAGACSRVQGAVIVVM